MTRLWQLAQNTDEMLNYSRTFREALLGLSMLRLIKSKHLLKGEVSEIELKEKVEKAIYLLDELVNDLKQLNEGEGGLKHITLIRLLEAEENITEPKILIERLSKASQELREFLEEKRENTGYAEELLEILASSSKREAYEAFSAMISLMEGARA